MPLAKAYDINRVWVSSSGFVSTAEFTVTFTDPSIPGFSSVHYATIDVMSAQIPEGASEEAMAAAFDQLIYAQIPGLEDYHSREIEFKSRQGLDRVVRLKPVPPPTSEDVNNERDRRIAAGISVQIDGYGPIPLQGRDQDQRNLLGLQAAASMRLAAGDNVTLTKFRDAENVDHMLVPSQIVELWSKGAAWISQTYDASWDIKAMDPIPSDFANDSYWP